MIRIFDTYSDGGSRGNPGESACGFAVYNKNDLVFKFSKYLGVSTNNKAEYWGVYYAFKWIAENINDKNTKVIHHVDSELITKQINKEYKIKNLELKKIFDKIQILKNKFLCNIEVVHVYRENNKMADALVNEALNKKE